MARGLVLVLLVASTTANAQPGPDRLQPPGMTDVLPPAPVVDDGRSTDRATTGVGFGMFASFPMSMEDPAITLFAAKPLWLGNRYRLFQWVAEVQGTFAYGMSSQHAYAVAGPYFGWNLYFGSVFGLEFRFGVDAIAQVGERMVGGITFGGTGGYVFRVWKDDRKRLKLLIQQHAGFYFAEDPGNDLGTNAMAFAVGVGYEQPL